jgi:hypothetical protein
MKKKIQSLLAGTVAVSFICSAVLFGALRSDAAGPTIWLLFVISVVTTLVSFAALFFAVRA